ncbi:tripartite tricarboxylate transporter substrate binding protein [Citricoccus sp.]|uniref:Bug family tripartite tricarboxylate transporter substrate binding protein n=1 Tax=Citricoccus sp. TaxID=1978372 RepID=UPI00261F78BD|nr:tripartite tricarboxylate transporter substrate binding protein [Citricoccus sp.]HRO30666.1 tripartite tricarboxylate transporter substrate binding protein [Citricoccus sp.]HRO94233.1 tripartite tricarboxylate transporter substrate binding protein [Citricoccus sp.]
MTFFTTRRTVLSVASAAALLSVTACGGNVGGGTADAADFPSGPVNITVGQAPGGSTDLIARAVGEGMSEDLDQPVTVVNQPGANGAVATKEVSGKAADGYELVLLNASLITITPLAVSEDEAVTLDDLDVIKGLSQDDYVLVASAKSGFENLEDIQAAGNLTYGTTGVGTGSQLAQAVLFAEAGIDGTEVPFDSGSPALTAVMGDQVQVATIQLGEAKPQIDAGTVTPIMTFSAERNEFLPDTPTATEAGYDIPVSQYRALAAPKGLPEEVKTRLAESADAALATEAYQSFNQDNLLTPHEISGEEVTEEWNSLRDRYAELVEEHDISLTGN